MNRIFKIIWNKTTQRLEVVSELAKGSVKASSTSSSEKNNKTLPVSILATLVTSILASSVSYAAINYDDIPKQGVAAVYDADSGILKNMALEGTLNSGVLSAIDAVSSLNTMLGHYKGFVHVNSEGDKTNKTGIWDDWLTAQDSKVEAETKNSGGAFSDNLGKFTEKSGAQGSRSVAVGVYANALAADSIAIGSRANVNNYWGNQYREALNGIAIGRQAQVEGATNSIAFGTNAKLLASTPYSLKPDNSIAIGNKSTVNWASNAIALGNNTSITGSHVVNRAWKGSDNSIAIGNETTVGGEDTVAIGSSVNAQRENTVAIGTNVTATRENSVVIGQNASATRERVVAIGAYATAGGDRTVAIGPEATANGSRSIVIGGLGDNKTDNQAKSESGANQAIVIGNGAQAKAAASYSITLGNSAKTEAATGISIGDRANVASGANNGIALGQGAVANNSGDIAIGQSSSTSTKHAVSDMKIGDTTLSKGVAATDNGTVSFGNDNVKRQIQNVGAGEISENSSDAITGSQLYHVIKAADEIAKTEYNFQVNGTNIKTMRNNGTSSANNANNTLDFKAGDGLEVAYENGAVTYKLNAESKKSIADAKAAAKTVSDKLVEIDKSVARAETAASNAANSATSAANSATSAANSATSAANSATSAANSATSAANSATSAANSATEAGKSATSAANSATSAANSATSAANSATSAANSATSAQNSATSAANSATEAGKSATSAANSA
ncbi:ESPR-type extended signal peptide-containing protein, partial [Haemophilus haemolyticus]|uniref:ESPR-type extended signal peptide-containing protein n=1 Tax=Haemophilus haemolyticus TaxID=726 RepID=UPI000517FEE3